MSFTVKELQKKLKNLGVMLRAKAPKKELVAKLVQVLKEQEDDEARKTESKNREAQITAEIPVDSSNAIKEATNAKIAAGSLDAEPERAISPSNAVIENVNREIKDGIIPETAEDPSEPVFVAAKDKIVEANTPVEKPSERASAEVKETRKRKGLVLYSYLW